MFDALIKKLLPNLVEKVRDSLLGSLKKSAAKAEAQKIAASYSRSLVKGIDAVANAAAGSLSAADAQRLVQGYVGEVRKNATEMADAVQAYAPLQLAVALAVKEHGDDSPQASAARAARKAHLETVRKEVREVLGQ